MPSRGPRCIPPGTAARGRGAVRCRPVDAGPGSSGVAPRSARRSARRASGPRRRDLGPASPDARERTVGIQDCTTGAGDLDPRQSSVRRRAGHSVAPAPWASSRRCWAAERAAYRAADRGRSASMPSRSQAARTRPPCRGSGRHRGHAGVAGAVVGRRCPGARTTASLRCDRRRRSRRTPPPAPGRRSAGSARGASRRSTARSGLRRRSPRRARRHASASARARAGRGRCASATHHRCVAHPRPPGRTTPRPRSCHHPATGLLTCDRIGRPAPGCVSRVPGDDPPRLVRRATGSDPTDDIEVPPLDGCMQAPNILESVRSVTR